MKYIRTKDGRMAKFYQDRSFDITCSFGVVDKKDILESANTIKELCDKFVLLYNDNGKLFSDTFDERFKEHIHGTKTFTNNFKAVYGFIWVELPNGAPRLEPVCKLNEQGELELI